MSVPSQIKEHSVEQSISNSDDTNSTKSGASSLPRTSRRNGARVARIVQSGFQLNQRISDLVLSGSAPNPGGASLYLSLTNTPDISAFLSKSQVPCRGQVINGHICFRLIPKIPRLLCAFNFAHSEGHNVVLVFNPANVSVPYVLNGTPSIYQGQEVDITEALRNGQNEILVNTTSVTCEILISIEWRDNETPESIVNKIVTQVPHMEVSPFNNYISEICPIGQKQIVTPGRGASCTHCQCFDLLTFIKNAQATDDWHCPICGQLLQQDSCLLYTSPSPRD